MKYVLMIAGRVVEVVPSIDRVQVPAPEPLAEGEVSWAVRDEQQAAHDSFVPGPVLLNERFHPDFLGTIEAVREVEDNVQVGIGDVYDGERYAPTPAPTPAAQTADGARAERERLLNMSDWTQLADVPEATRTAWRKYRQALRDVPAQKGFPTDVKWPKEPS